MTRKGLSSRLALLLIIGITVGLGGPPAAAARSWLPPEDGELAAVLENTAPAAANDAYAVESDETLAVGAAEGVLANDSDPDGDPLTAQLVQDVTHGSLTLNADGSFQYTASGGYVGEEVFVYQAFDGQALSNEALVEITVDPANTPPVAVADAYELTSGITLATTAGTGVLANDTDLDGDPLTALLLSPTTVGALTLNADGSFTYVPASGYVGLDLFTYRAFDGESLSNAATVTFTVLAGNARPLAAADSYSVAVDSVLTVPVELGVLANDQDPDGDPLTAQQLGLPGHGSVALAADGSFVYTPALGYIGIDRFTYQASDGEAVSLPAVVTISVVGQPNTAPVAVADTYEVASDTTLPVIAANGLLANDSDPDGDSLTARLLASPPKGTLTLNEDGSFVYTPNAGFVGTDRFTYQAYDGQYTSRPAMVSISVTAENRAPIATADSYRVRVDCTLLVSAALGVLANDIEPDGDPITAQLLGTTAQGTLVLQPDGSFVYTPKAGYTGNDTFTYQVSDGIATSIPARVTIAVYQPYFAYLPMALR